ncbi:MAG: aspartate aminotransferase [Gammaproteobacteria bacterium]|nr:aspartate aminotransferase [Gammaproteobacteria bacterium]
MKDGTQFDEFNRIIDRSGTYSSKWDRYSGSEILPFWVADMDFATPDFIRLAIQQRLDHPVLGYTRQPTELNQAFLSWLKRSQNWEAKEEWIVWIPSVVAGLNIAAKSLAKPNGSIAVPTPIYYPFLDVPRNAGQQAKRIPLVKSNNKWVMDFDRLEKACDKNTSLLLLCNPQNPTGRMYSRDELDQLAEFCIDHNIHLCSDEIHCSLQLDPNLDHTSIASLDDVIGQKTITLFSITKTYNIPGLSAAVAVIPNDVIRNNFITTQRGLSTDMGPLTLAANLSALNDESEWVPSLLQYLRNNHKLVLETLGQRMTPVEGTYLAWIDLQDLNLKQPARTLEKYGIGLSEGEAFGSPGYVRFNFACPKPILVEGLSRLANALAELERRL